MIEEEKNHPVSRRGVLRAAVGGTATVTAASTEAAAQETTIDMNDNLEFVPAEAQVDPGTTVTWENVGSIEHSVTAYEDEIPDEAEYFASGDFDSESSARDAYPDGSIGGDGTYEHTFETEGEYGYFCIPHESAGMTGTVTVGRRGGGDGGGGGGAPTLPDSAKTLGIVAAGAMSAVLGLAYFFIKYGGDYGEFE